jgi:dipeptidyl aminopeptidase/acylaminoacyl peptidase
MQLVDALQRAKKIFDLALYPQKTHGVEEPAASQLNATMLEFFDRWLK